MPHGVLINGKGPYRYNDTLVPDGIEHETIQVHPGNTNTSAKLVKRKRFCAYSVFGLIYAFYTNLALTSSNFIHSLELTR